MAISKKGLYDLALTELGERRLKSLSDDLPSRYVLDTVWDEMQFPVCALEDGQWRHAVRTVKLVYDSTISPDFGYQYAFPQPSDFVRLVAISADQYFYNPLTDYEYENDYFFTSFQDLYMRYVSSDESYGLDYSKWSPAFIQYTYLKLAYHAAPRIVQDMKKREAVIKHLERAMTKAFGKDAANRPTVFIGKGGWNKARMTSYYRRDRERGR